MSARLFVLNDATHCLNEICCRCRRHVNPGNRAGSYRRHPLRRYYKRTPVSLRALLPTGEFACDRSMRAPRHIALLVMSVHRQSLGRDFTVAARRADRAFGRRVQHDRDSDRIASLSHPQAGRRPGAERGPTRCTVCNHSVDVRVRATSGAVDIARRLRS
jgi:hypothetical protein